MTIILTFLKQLDEIDTDLRERQDIYNKHVTSSVPTIYQLIKVKKWSNWHQNTEKNKEMMLLSQELLASHPLWLL